MLVQHYNRTEANQSNRVNAEKFQEIEAEQAKIEEDLIMGLQEDARMTAKIRKQLEDCVPRLSIDITEFDPIVPGLSRRIMNQPAIVLPPINNAVRELFQIHMNNYPQLVPNQDDRAHFKNPRIALKGWLRGATITPRGLKAARINKVVAIEGIVTRCGMAKHQIVKSLYLAENSTKKVEVDYNQDLFYKSNNSQIVPITDPDGNRYILESGLTDFKKVQTFVLQEMPEIAPSGELPVSVEVIVSGSLVDQIKAGDRVSVWGVYKAKMHKDQGRLSGLAKCWIEANNIEHLGGNSIAMSIETDDEKLIRRIAKRQDTLQHLAHSIAPTLFGGLEKKKGLLLQLLGGVQKCLENDTMRVRGDINILLIGDPSCGKSQMLRFMMNVSKLAISTTGRGSSGVGLTAAARMDDENRGERVLEAGAMVMADGGLVCIDEFDKMTQDDRTAIHEVMEQQTVSISKASIQTTLNARCSVLAAANPTYGCFDDTKDYRSQITFPDSLMSRFDLIYLVHEANQPSEDRRICRTVLKNHMQKAQEHAMMMAEGRPSNSTTANFSGVVNRVDWTILPRDDCNAHQNAYDKQDANGNAIYSINFLKKYIQLAKSKTPELTQEAISSIADYYCHLRKQCSQGTRGRFAVPTARTLEAAIRLSTAHAKLKLKDRVDADDVLKAKQLLHFTMLGEEYEDEEAEPLPVAIANKATDRAAPKRPSSRKRGAATPNVEDVTASVAEKMGHRVQKRQKTKKTDDAPPPQTGPTAEELSAALRLYTIIKEKGEEDTIEKSAFFDRVVEENGGAVIEPAAFAGLLEELARQNRVMVDGDEIFIV